MNTMAANLEQADATHVRSEGRKCVYFGGCDYLRLSWDPRVRRALVQGMETYGLNVAASRTTTGNHPLYEQLEQRIARFFEFDNALLVSAGYFAGMAVAQGLAGEFTHVLIDEHAHKCLQDAARFFRCPILTFAHCNPTHLGSLVESCGRSSRPIVLTDGMYAHNGSVAPLAAYLNVLPARGRLLVDDAHGAGVLGRQGQGAVEWENLDRRRVILAVTLSKAFGGYGGAILANNRIRRQIVGYSSIFSGNTPLPLPWVNVGLKSLELCRKEPERLLRLQANASLVKDRLRQAGMLEKEHPGPIISHQPTSRQEARQLSLRLAQAGIFPSLIQYPGAMKGPYFRFAISSEHTKASLRRLADCLIKHGQLR